jgi:predicted AlkP superfamily pyrophosphatase or phosphodiesterase
VNAAIGQADTAVARLVEGLRARNLSASTNIVIVADHGMTAVDATDRLILIDQFVDVTKLNAVAFGAYIGVNPNPGSEVEVERAMLAPHPHMTCWRKADIPGRLHYGTNARVPAIFCLAEPGWLILTQQIGAYAQIAYPDGFRGNHGYDPAVADMAALFIAHGPAFRRGVTLGGFENTSVYPMLARVLGLAPEANDGDIADLAPALAE